MDETLLCATEDAIYERPNIDYLLTLISWMKNVTQIVWSTGNKEYVHGCLRDCGFKKYFKTILTWEDCTPNNDICLKDGTFIRKYISANELAFVFGIDDLADETMTAGYDRTLKVKPFQSKDTTDNEVSLTIIPYIVECLSSIPK